VQLHLKLSYHPYSYHCCYVTSSTLAITIASYVAISLNRIVGASLVPPRCYCNVAVMLLVSWHEWRTLFASRRLENTRGLSLYGNDRIARRLQKAQSVIGIQPGEFPLGNSKFPRKSGSVQNLTS